LGVLNLTNNLGKGLNIGAEGSNFSLDRFKRHVYIIPSTVIKSLSPVHEE